MAKDLNHHEHRLLERMVQAESATDRSTAQRILRKVKKHQRKVFKLRRMIRNIFGRGED